MAITNKGKIDTSALQAELNDATAKKKGGGGGAKLKDIICRQSELPHGTVSFRVLPPTDDMHGMPWVRSDEHFFYDRTAGAIFSYNCPGRDDPGCKLAYRMIDAGRERDGKGWQAKTKLRMNVIFTGWGDEQGACPIPEKFAGKVVILEFGRGIWRGTHKTEVGGLLKLLQDAQEAEEAPFYDPEEGSEVLITKTGYELDTNYRVELASGLEEITVGGKKQKVSVKKITPLHPDQRESDKLLAARHNLQVFLREKTLDEIRAGLEPFEEIVQRAEEEYRKRHGHAPKGGPKGRGGQAQTSPTKRPAKSLQDELDGDDDSKIPF